MSAFNVLSYAVACVAFAALALLAFISDRRIPQGRALALAALASAAWAGLLTVMESGHAIPYWTIVAVEFVRDACWLRFLIMLAPPQWPRVAQLIALVVLAGWVVAGAMASGPVRVLTRGGLVAALLGLVILEQATRNAPPELRREMKFLIMGIGGMFAFDLFLFSQAELFLRFDGESWHLRGIVNAALVPFLIVGARRLPNVKFELFVSREVTFYTTAFIAVGTYTLITAGAGLLIQRFGGQWGEFIRPAFLVGAIVVLFALVGSDTIRRQLRVFLSKHFYRTRYDYRLEWLRFIRTLSTASASDVPVAAVKSVAQILNSPGGILYRQPDGASAFVPIGSWPASLDVLSEAHAFPAKSSLVEFMRARRWIIDLREREREPGLYDNASVPLWVATDPRWRLLSPIFLGDTLLGFFLLLEPPPPFRLMYEDRDLLNTAGQHVATLLAQQDADQRVTELSQFETFNRLTTFVMHDLKNCAAQLSLLVGNAARHKHNPEFIDDAISTISQTSERMTRLIAQLRGKAADTAAGPIELQEALQIAIARCASRKPQPVLEHSPDQSCIVSADPERLTAALEHVIRNAQEASGDDGSVLVKVDKWTSKVQVSISDTGPGMDAEFIRSRLFRPFDTTKAPGGMGIGAYQAREFARSVGGSVEVRSEPGRGTWFAFELPLASP